MSWPADEVGRASVFDTFRRWIGGITLFNVLSVLVALFLAFIAIYPLTRVVLRLFFQDGRLDLSALVDMLTLPDLVGLLVRTTVVVMTSAALALVIGATLAWLLERTDARMGVVGDALPLLPFLLPPVAGAVGWVLLLSPRAGLLNAWMRDVLGWFGVELTEGPLDIYTWYGLILGYTVYQVPYAYLMVSTGLRNMDPALEEQSRICGGGTLRTLTHVTLRSIKPSLGGAVLLMVWFGFSLYSIPAIIGTGAGIEVLSVRIVNLLKFTFPPETDVAVGLSLFVLLFVGTAYFLQVRMLRSGRNVTIAGKGRRAAVTALGRWRWPARLLVSGYIVVAAVLPLLALVLVSLNGFWTPDLDWGDFNLSKFREVLFDDLTTQRALRNSLYLGIAGATIGMVFAAMVSLLVRRSSYGFGRVVDGMVKLPAAISNMVIAVGFVLAFSGAPFMLGGTLLILLLAYLALYMPQASVASDVAASQVGDELMEASSVCGGSGMRTFVRVNLPLMLPGLLAGWALLFVRMVGDLTASSILAGTSNNVIGFRILEVFTAASYANLAALSVMLSMITTTVLVVVLAFTRRRTGPNSRSAVGR